MRYDRNLSSKPFIWLSPRKITAITRDRRKISSKILTSMNRIKAEHSLDIFLSGSKNDKI